MSWRRAAALVAFTAVAVTGCGSSGSGSGSSALPDFAVTAIPATGATSPTTTTALTGKPMVVNLWAPWCPPCRTEMPDFDAVAAAHPEMSFVGIATGTEQQAAADFATKVGVKYGLYYDVDDVALDRLGVTDLPATLFVDASGRILSVHHGALTKSDLESELASAFRA